MAKAESCVLSIPNNYFCLQFIQFLQLFTTAVPAEMWEQLLGHVDKKAHMKAMFELTTRMNSLARIVVGPANISATTALQVRPQHWWRCWKAYRRFVGQARGRPRAGSHPRFPDKAGPRLEDPARPRHA